MIIGDNYVFIHVPKTGGMSVTQWLINNTDGIIRVVAPESAFDHAKLSALYPNAKDRLEFIEGSRHENLPDARAMLDKLGLPEPEFVFSIIRDPYDLIRSYYHYLSKPHVVGRRSVNGSLDPDFRAANDGSFENFVKTCSFFTRTPDDVLKYFNDANSFERVDVVPLESIDRYLSHRFFKHKRYGCYNLEQRNASKKDVVSSEIEKVTRQIVYKRYNKVHEIFLQVSEEKVNAERWNDHRKQRGPNHVQNELENKDEQIECLRRELSDAVQIKNNELGDLRERLKSMTEAKDVQIHFLRGGNLLAKGEEEEAIQAFRESLRLNPKQFPAHFQLARAYENIGNYDLSKQHLETAIGLDPSRQKQVQVVLERLAAGSTDASIPVQD